MQITEPTQTIETPARREFKPRGAFGLDYVSRTEYATSCGSRYIEANGHEWDAWNGETFRTFTTMKAAARYARRA